MKSVFANNKLGELFVNQQAFAGFLAQYLHRKFYAETRDKALAAGPEVITEDAATKKDTTQYKIEMLGDKVENALSRVGDAMSPVVERLNALFGAVGTSVAWLDTKLPGAINVAIAALMSFAGALGFVAVLKNLGSFLGGGLPGFLKPGAPKLPGLPAATTAPGAPAALKTPLQEAEELFKKPGAAPSPSTAAKALPMLLRGAGAVGLGLAGLDALTWANEAGLNAWSQRTGMPAIASEDAGDRQGAVADIAGRWGRRPGAGGAEQPAQKTDVSGQITIKVDGPGAVTSATSTNPNVALSPDRGAAVLRP